MEIFDVTETDPSLLVTDDLGVNYTDENMIISPAKSTSSHKSRHCSGPAAFNRQRRSSESAFNSRTFPRNRVRKTSSETPNFRGKIQCFTHWLDIKDHYDLVGDLESDDDGMDTDTFSDPEADWVEQTLHTPWTNMKNFVCLTLF